MTAIAGTSLFYSVVKTLNETTPISYYQFKAFEAFLDVLILHDELHLFVGKEGDTNYLRTFGALTTNIHANTDFKISLITDPNYLHSSVIQKFNEICTEIYGHPLGIVSEQLFTKISKTNRIEDDLSEIVTSVSLKDFNSREFSKRLYETYSKNANTATFTYLFRGHLFQAIAEILQLTPVFVNHRLIADILNRSTRKNRVGTLAFSIYKMVNSLFLHFCINLNHNNRYYPFSSILMMDLISRVENRENLLAAIYEMREEYKSFRDEYKKIETTLNSNKASLQEKARAKKKFERYIQEVWLPTMNSLSENRGIIGRQLKKSLGKFNIIDSKLEATTKYEDEQGISSSSEAKSNVNLTGFGLEVVSLIGRIGKDAYLMNSNRPLLNSIKKILETPEIEERFMAILPIKEFSNTKFQEIDSILWQIEKEES